MNSHLALVTVAGGDRFGDEFSRTCVSSWVRIEGIDGPKLMINGGLTATGRNVADEYSFTVIEKNDERIREAVRNRPGLDFIRRKLYTWRHIVDGLILCSDAEYIVFIDTDVFVTRSVSLPLQDAEFLYNCDDIPGFRGSWTIPLKERMVPSINPGFLVVKSSAVDLDVLNELILRYFMSHRDTFWWTRQTAMAILVGRSPRSFIFDGDDVRVFSGNYKRTPKDIRRNRWRYFGSSRPVTDESRARQAIQGASILHLAGLGKRWLHIAEGFIDEDSSPYQLGVSPAKVATPFESVVIAIRLLLLQSAARRKLFEILRSS